MTLRLRRKHKKIQTNSNEYKIKCWNSEITCGLRPHERESRLVFGPNVLIGHIEWCKCARNISKWDYIKSWSQKQYHWRLNWIEFEWKSIHVVGLMKLDNGHPFDSSMHASNTARHKYMFSIHLWTTYRLTYYMNIIPLKTH